MYDINDPPPWQEQFALFPERTWGQENLIFIYIKMEDSTEQVPLVFCADCASPKYARYCNDGYTYEYRSCDLDADFYCPRFYAELLRRIWMNPRIAHDFNLKTVVRHIHAEGCIHSGSPDFIVQGAEGLANSIYFRHCTGAFKNAMMKSLCMEAINPPKGLASSKWIQQQKRVNADQVPGLEWKETKRVQNLVIIEDITHL